MSKISNKIVVEGSSITIFVINEQDFISLTDMVRALRTDLF